MFRATLATLSAAALFAGVLFCGTIGTASAGELSIRFGGHSVQGYGFRYGRHGGVRKGRGVRRHRGDRRRGLRRHRIRPRFVYRYAGTSHITVVRPRVIYQTTPGTYWAPAPRVTVRDVRPAPEPAVMDRRYCREYQRTVTIDGAPVEAYGTACRQPDGSWRMIALQ